MNQQNYINPFCLCKIKLIQYAVGIIVIDFFNCQHKSMGIIVAG
jgi:hypothetical protein